MEEDDKKRGLEHHPSLEEEKTSLAQKRVLRRRVWTPEEKSAIVEETREIGKTVSSVAREYGLSNSQLFCWRSEEEKRRLEEAKRNMFVVQRIFRKIWEKIKRPYDPLKQKRSKGMNRSTRN